MSTVIKRSTIRVITLLLLLASAISVTFSLGGNHWITDDESTRGLWKQCMDNGDCEDIENVQDWFVVVRYTVITGLGFLLLSACYFIAMAFQPKAFKGFPLTVLLSISCVFMIVGISVFTNYAKGSFHWSYAMCWIAVIFGISSTIVSVFDLRRPSTPYDNVVRLE